MESLVIPANGCSLQEICDVLQRGYSDYAVQIDWSPSMLLDMIRLYQVDLRCSFLLQCGGKNVGCILMGRRGRRSRLSAFCIQPSHRQILGGRELLNHMLKEAKERGDSHIELEVLVDNFPAIHLYEEYGFRAVDDLVSYTFPPPTERPHNIPTLREVTIEEVAETMLMYEAPMLPWQIAPETLFHMTPPYEAYHLREGWCLLTRPEKQVTLRAFFVTPEHQRLGVGRELLTAIRHRYPSCSLHIPALFPASLYRGFCEALGAKYGSFRQHYMQLVF